MLLRSSAVSSLLPHAPVAFAELCTSLGVPAPPPERGVYVLASPWPGLARVCIVGHDGELLHDGLIAARLVTPRQRARWEIMLATGAPVDLTRATDGPALRLHRA